MEIKHVKGSKNNLSITDILYPFIVLDTRQNVIEVEEI